MSRRSSFALAALAVLISALPADSAPTQDLRRSITLQTSGRPIRHTTNRDGNVIDFAVSTPQGELRATRRRVEDAPGERVEFRLAGSDERMLLDLSGDVSVVRVAATYPEIGRLALKIDARTKRAVVLDAPDGDPNLLLSHPLYVALSDLALELLDEQRFNERPDPSSTRMLELIVPVVLAPTKLDGFSGSFSPMSSFTCREQDDFDRCSRCCDNLMGLIELTCNAGAISTCGDAWCAAAAFLLCGMISDLEQAMCVTWNCAGRPGDPHCNPHVPCASAGGVCYASDVCGIISCPACGSCSDGRQCCGSCN
ncbi:MAG: hypothetical protein GY716_20755 [bacterium]|nr:hypothetical protein [bacterium]